MYFWDFLRPLTEFAASIDLYVKFFVFFIALILAVIAFFAFKRKPETKRFLFLALAFLFFAFKWFLKILDIFFSPGMFLSDPSENVIELIILFLLFLAVLKKQ